MNHLKNIWFVCFTVFHTSNLGILVAFYREKLESSIPPILIYYRKCNYLNSNDNVID